MALEQGRLHSIESRCTQESSPRCRVACPLDVDVRTMLELIGTGKLRESRAIIEKYLPLPAILSSICDHPCEGVCLRRDLGGSLAISALEKFCFCNAPAGRSPLPPRPKAKKIAAIGGGLASLTLAFDLSRKGYPVHVLHHGSIEDYLSSTFPNLNINDCLIELNSLKKRGVTFSEAVIDNQLLDNCSKEYDAVFIDTSCCDFLPDRQDIDPITLLLRDNICCGGWLKRTPANFSYLSPSSQASDGRRAAITIQRMLDGASLFASRENENRVDRLHVSINGIVAVPHVIPADKFYTEAEAISEATRCLPCTCMQCVKECVYMQQYGEFPRVYARKIYNNAAVVRGTRTANVIMNGCSLCGQCEVICPEHFSMTDLCLEARQDAVERNVMPASAHEFALEDMEQACGANCSFWIGQQAEESGSYDAYVFFPGCQLAGSRNYQVLDMYRYLRNTLAGGVALYSSCCGMPAHWAGREKIYKDHAQCLREEWQKHGKPRIIVACSSCNQSLKILFPDSVIISLWELLDDLISPVNSKYPPNIMTIHDPCGARHDKGWRKAVRSLASKVNIRIEEASRSGDESACCGYGGVVWNAQPDLADKMTQSLKKQFTSPPLCSCIMCHDRLALLGKAFHMFDILPMTASYKYMGMPIPGLSARRLGRADLKQMALKEFNGIDIIAEKRKFNLEISDELRQTMERRFILEQDVFDALEGIENGGSKFLNRENNHFLGSWRPRNVTFWIEYAKIDDGFILYDVWCHRMVAYGVTQPSQEVVFEDYAHA